MTETQQEGSIVAEPLKGVNSTILYVINVRSTLETPRKLSRHQVGRDYDTREKSDTAYVFAPQGDTLTRLLKQAEDREVDFRGKQYIARASLVGVVATRDDIEIGQDKRTYWKHTVPISILPV